MIKKIGIFTIIGESPVFHLLPYIRISMAIYVNFVKINKNHFIKYVNIIN